MEKYYTMSQKELTRMDIVKQLLEKRMTQAQASLQLDISIRQVQRLVCAYQHNGASGLISKKRGMPSNRKIPDTVKEMAITLIREQYHDFGRILAQEKLSKHHNITVGLETLRQWMLDTGLWRDRKQKRTYQPRYRRECYINVLSYKDLARLLSE